MEYKIIGSGVFSKIIEIDDGKKVLKAFKRDNKMFEGTEYTSCKDRELILKAVCFTEMKAYQILHEGKELSRYIPHFYGTYNPALIDETAYIQDAGFIIEKIKKEQFGTDIKFNALSQTQKIAVQPILLEISEKLRPLNIESEDACCFYINQDNFRFIDFALWKYSPYLEELKCHDELSEKSKKALELLCTQLKTSINQVNL